MGLETDKDTEIFADSGDTPTVFFSYSRSDQPEAIRIIKKIEEQGYSVWWDGILQAGTDFQQITEAALEAARVVVVLWSKTSIESHWVRDEATSGRVRNCLIPLSLDGTIPPLGFRQVQVINVQNWETDPAIFGQLNHVLSGLHDQDGGITQTIQTPVRGDVKQPARRSLLKLGIFGAGTLALGGSAAFIFNQRLSVSDILENGVAVLPFENLAGSSEYDYISNGLSSEIRSALAQNAALKVVARSSSQSVFDNGLSAQQISETLKVAYVLEGTVNKTINGIRVSIDFVDGRRGFSELSRAFEISNEGILELYADIKKALIDTLTQHLQPDMTNSVGETQNPVAFNEYLKGNTLLRARLDTQTIKQAQSHYETALGLDRDFGLAHVSRAQLLLWQGISSTDHSQSAIFLDEAVASARRAIASAPSLVDAHSVLGYILFTGKLDIAGADIAYKKASDIGLKNNAAFARYAVYLATTGQDRLALDNALKAAELDPLNPTSQETLGLVHLSGGRFRDAIAAYESVKQTSPDRYNVNARLGLSHIFLGDVERGLAICAEEKNETERLPCLAIGEFKNGNTSAAQDAMQTLIETYGDRTAYQQAQILAQWGKRDAALSMLQKAKDLGDTGLTLALIDPALEPLSDNPAFLKLLAEIGFKV